MSFGWRRRDRRPPEGNPTSLTRSLTGAGSSSTGWPTAGASTMTHIGRSGPRSSDRLRADGSDEPHPARTLRGQLVRVVRKSFAPVLGHQEEILEAQLADVGLPQTGLDGDDIAGDQLAMPGLAKARILMDLEANAVAERELKALVRILLPGSRSLSAMPGGLEHVADDGLQRTP